MITYWLTRVGIPLVAAVVLFAVAGLYESQFVALMGLVALGLAGGGGRDYRIYRTAHIRSRANHDARRKYRD